jgi:hypothetical protein
VRFLEGELRIAPVEPARPDLRPRAVAVARQGAGDRISLAA